MPPVPTSSVHDSKPTQKQFEDPLVHARASATRKHQYNSEKTRKALSNLVSERCNGKQPYPWQLDTAEALLLGLDAVVIAGTGAGKTLPFMMPLLLDKEKKILVISPLKALQRDQVGLPDELEMELTLCTETTLHKDGHICHRRERRDMV